MICSLAIAAGCGQDIQFSDSIDLEFDLLRRGDQLHLPYVVGAAFTVCADSAHEGALAGMRLRSGDPEIFEVGPSDLSDDEDHICASADALQVGEVELQVVDTDDEVVGSTLLDVRAPDRAELRAAGPLFADRPDLDPRVEQPQILDGGTATFQVLYYEGTTRLYGQGALVVDSIEGVAARAIGTVLFEDREWLQLTAHEPGERTLALATSEGPFHALDLDVVTEDAIADVALHGSDERGRHEGDALVVYAQAYDEDDTPIFGVEYDWSLGGIGEPGTGDLFRYEYDPEERNELSAQHGELGAVAEIRAGEGYVDSSNYVGCSVGGRRGGAWALVGLGLLGIGRRRRRA